MSFYVDPLILLADGEIHARLMPESAQGGGAKLGGALAVGTTLVFSIGSYLDADWAKGAWKPFGAKSGTAFMLGWPFSHKSRHRRTTRTDAAAALMFAGYPLWWWLGWDHGRRRRPRASS